jgi:hypothetical protein
VDTTDLGFPLIIVPLIENNLSLTNRLTVAAGRGHRRQRGQQLGA